MIDVKYLCVSYGGTAVLKNCSLRIEKGERAALMGPSGCGKTTLINSVAGLVKPDSGSVDLHGGRPSYVFQEPRLFPWLTALQNVNAVLSDKKASLHRSLEWLRAVGLEDAADKYPAELSGGMQQRISIARALASGGDILLLDEPLKGMDSALKRDISALIARSCAGRTLLMVTHDEEEARALDACIYRFRDGQFLSE